jgi:DNA processing protein
VVLPCGLDAIHPRIHEAEAARMVSSGGLLLTERPPQTSVERWMFAARNRIITGLAPATVVVQSPARGGSLISAQCALDQNRELYVFHPPSGSPRWSGNRGMVEDGWGEPARDPMHLWNVMAGLPSAQPAWQRSVPPSCRPVWNCLSAKRAIRLDELAVELDEAQVRRHVAVLVSLGLVARLPGRRYVRA